MNYQTNINGITVAAYYSDESIETIFLPLLEKLAGRQKLLGRRLIVMVAAPPGAGKSTFVSFLEKLGAEHPIGARVQAAGMDGFHRRQEYLLSHKACVDGREILMVDIKGAPETFDLAKLKKYIAKAGQSGTFTWPSYDRHRHDPVEDAITIDCDILLIEGNYLLLNEEGWDGISEHADYTIFITAEEEVLRRRLIDRKEASGHTRDKAVAFVDFSDMRNVKLCLERSKPADLELRSGADGSITIL